jgi:streptomycin 6-kinase
VAVPNGRAVGIPEALARNVVGFQGDGGREWLEQVPGLLSRFCDQWKLKLGDPCAGMYYNYLVRAARADGTRAVLKLGVPGGPIHSEVDALQAFDGRGCVRLLESDREAGVMLLERVEPGDTPKTVEDDDEATRIAARVTARVRRSVPESHSFATVGKWAEGLNRLRATFDGGTGPFPATMVRRAEELYS